VGKKASKGRKDPSPTYYQNYILREDEHPPRGLLGLQRLYGKGVQAHPDELLFIAIHQTYEIWFKVMIDAIQRKGTGVVARIQAGAYPEASRALRRMTRITNILREQYSIVETISPTDFLVFRDVLRPSSGYDSAQFRAVELASGLRGDGSYLRHLCGANASAVKDAAALAPLAQGVAAAVAGKRDPGLREYSVLRKLATTGDANGLRLISAALGSPSLRDAAYAAVERQAQSAPSGAWQDERAREWAKAQAEASAKNAPFEIGVGAQRAARIMHGVASLYRAATAGNLGKPRARALLDLVEALIEYDEAFRNLRMIHINMVLRVIGDKPGTGGSTGAQYLRSTLDYEFFPLLWRARDHIEDK
jgi:tryptophan 2,3-dioxygenase